MGICEDNRICMYVCVVLDIARLVEWLSQWSGGRERRASHDEHVAGEVTAVAAKLEQKEAELRKVSEK